MLCTSHTARGLFPADSSCRSINALPPPSFIPGSFLERPPSRFKPSSRSSSSILSNKVTRPRPPLLPFHLSTIDDEATSTVLVSSIDRSPRCMLKWPSADPLELFVRCIHTCMSIRLSTDSLIEIMISRACG